MIRRPPRSTLFPYNDALPICRCHPAPPGPRGQRPRPLRKNRTLTHFHDRSDRKSTRLNSSHSQISYAVFCLKKKKKKSFLVASVQIRVSRLAHEQTYLAHTEN